MQQQTCDIGASDRGLTTLTTSEPNFMKVGDRVLFRHDTNKMRRIVVCLDGLHACSLKVFLRPSKGFRRHVRRMKSRRTVENLSHCQHRSGHDDGEGPNR